VREKYCWLVADKPSEQGVSRLHSRQEMEKSDLQTVRLAGG
jgi:hypothetical protein